MNLRELLKGKSDRVVASAENGCANADNRCPFRNGDGVVVTHAHGEFGECDGKFAFQTVAEFTETAECGMKNGIVRIQRSHSHETEQLNAGKSECMFRRFTESVPAGKTEFGFLARNIDFQQNLLNLSAFILFSSFTESTE